MSITSVTPVVTNTIQQAQGQLEADQLSALLAAIESSGVISLPNGLSFSSLQALSITIIPSGGGRFNLTIRS